jgi:uncharacterized membrane protein
MELAATATRRRCERSVPRILPLIVALVASLAIATARAQDNGAQSFTGSFQLAGRPIALPAGEWRLLADERMPAEADARTLPGLRTAILARLDGGTVIGLISATVNEAPATSGWGIAQDCARNDVYLAVTSYQSPIDVSCTFVNHVVTPPRPSGPTVWHDAAARIAEAGWSLPSTWLMAGFRVTDRQEFLDLRYHFNPDAMAPPVPVTSWREGPWVADAVQRDHLHASLVNAVIRWAATTRPAVEQSLHDRPPQAADAGWPWGGAPASGGGSAMPLALGVAAQGLDWETGLAKTLTWRVLGTMSDIAVAYGFTGSPMISGGIALVGAVVNGGLYFLHEMAWSAFKGAGESALPVLETAYIGIAS